MTSSSQLQLLCSISVPFLALHSGCCYHLLAARRTQSYKIYTRCWLCDWMLIRAMLKQQVKQSAQSQQGEGSRARQQDDRRDGSKPVPKWMKLGKK